MGVCRRRADDKEVSKQDMIYLWANFMVPAQYYIFSAETVESHPKNDYTQRLKTTTFLSAGYSTQRTTTPEA